MNIKEIEVENADGTKSTHIIIDKGNNEFTSMPKSVWDEIKWAEENNGQ